MSRPSQTGAIARHDRHRSALVQGGDDVVVAIAIEVSDHDLSWVGRRVEHDVGLSCKAGAVPCEDRDAVDIGERDRQIRMSVVIQIARRDRKRPGARLIEADVDWPAERAMPIAEPDDHVMRRLVDAATAKSRCPSRSKSAVTIPRGPLCVLTAAASTNCERDVG